MKKFLLMVLSMMLSIVSASAASLADRNYPPYNTSVTVTSSNLPLIWIKTTGTLSRTDRILGYMKVINNADGINYADTTSYPNQTIEFDGPIAIKYRGSSSFGGTSQTKKPMSVKLLKTTDITGKKQKAELLGMGKDNDWTFLAPWQDLSYIRDILTMEMARGGSAFAPQMRYCEVFIDNIYYGVFILSERATKGSQRLNLWDFGEDEDGNAIEDMSGDFHVEIDRDDDPENDPYYTSKYHPVYSNGTEITDKYISYQYKDPEGDDFADLPGAQDSLHKAIDDMEAAFYSSNYKDLYSDYIDVESFMDYEIAQEVSNNIDGYRLSTPLWKYSRTHAATTGDNDKWKLALWDFNIAYGHNYGSYYYPSREAWRYTANDIMDDSDSDDAQLIPFYWYKLMKDDAYVNKIKARYTERRQTNYSDARVTAICDSLKNVLNQGAVKRDNSAWNNNFRYWTSNISSVESFTKDRLAWMDDYWYDESLIDPTDPGEDEPTVVTTGATPLTIASGYNMDVICESSSDISGTVYTGDNCGIDASGFVFYTSTVKTSGYLCKNDGLYSSENASYFSDVDGENALVLKSALGTTGTLTLSEPTRTSTLYITGTSADGNSYVNVVVNYTDGTSTSATSFYMPNWDDDDTSGATVAVSSLGRMAAIKNWAGSAGTFSSSNKFNVFETAIATDSEKSVESVSFSRTSGTSTAIFSISGVVVSDQVVETPSLSTDVETLSFETEVGTPVSKTFTITAENLTEDVAVTLTDENEVYAVDVTSIKADEANEYVVTVTYSPTASGSFSGVVTLTSGTATASVSLEGTATAAASDDDTEPAGGEASDNYLNLHKYSTVESVGYSTRVENLIAYTVQEDGSAWMTMSPYGAYCSIDTQKWIYCSKNAYYRTTWSAEDIFLGSGAYFASGGYALASNQYLTAPAIQTYYVYNCTGFKLKAYNPNSSKTVQTTITVSAFDLNENGTFDPSSESTTVYNEVFNTKKSYYIANVEDLEADKVYKIQLEVYRTRVYEVGFQTTQSNWTITEAAQMGNVNGISEVNNDVDEEVRIFNLQGVYLGNDVENLEKGVYIINGKKIAIE